MPLRHIQNKGKTVRQGQIERFGADVTLVVVFGNWRVHCRPAITQIIQEDPLGSTLVDDWKLLVLDFWTAATTARYAHHFDDPVRRSAENAARSIQEAAGIGDATSLPTMAGKIKSDKPAVNAGRVAIEVFENNP